MGLRILFFNYEYPPLGGGGGVFLRDICEILAADHELTVITSHHASLPKIEKKGNLTIYREPVLLRRTRSTASMVSMLSYFPASMWRGYRILSGQTFDVINSHFAVPSAPSGHILARRYNVPHVITVQGGDLSDPSKFWSPHRLPIVRTLVRRLLTKGDRIVAASRNSVANATNIYGIERPIDLIPLGIRRFPVPENTSRRELGLADDALVMVTVGRIVRRKNLGQMIEVVRQLSDPKAILVIIGEGPERRELEELARRRGVESQVRFAGRVSDEDKARYLSESDLYVSTSDHEGFGLVFLEALHCGLPVVCYDNGGQTDFLENGKTGFLVNHGDIGAFVASVRRLKDEPGLRDRCQQRALEVVSQYYVDRCAEDYARLFTDLVEENRAGAGTSRQ